MDFFWTHCDDPFKRHPSPPFLCILSPQRLHLRMQQRLGCRMAEKGGEVTGQSKTRWAGTVQQLLPSNNTIHPFSHPFCVLNSDVTHFFYFSFFGGKVGLVFILFLRFSDICRVQIKLCHMIHLSQTSCLLIENSKWIFLNKHICADYFK